MNQDLHLTELEREALANPEDLLLQRRFDRQLLRAGQRQKVEQRLSERLSSPARWPRLKGGGIAKDRSLRPRLCSHCSGPALRCDEPEQLKDLVATGACIACSEVQRPQMLRVLIDHLSDDEYQEPQCLMSFKSFGPLTVTSTQGQASNGLSYCILDLEGSFDGSEAGGDGPFYEEFERLAAAYDYLIVTMERIDYFDEMAFSIFSEAQSILRKKGGDLLLSSLKKGYIAALQIMAGNIFEATNNIYRNEEDALAAIESHER